jgi:hypothetical protein
LPIAAIAGVNKPFGCTALLADHVPPPGVAVNIKALPVLHKGGGMFSVGVKGL